jgi:hypothetical protein
LSPAHAALCSECLERLLCSLPLLGRHPPHVPPQPGTIVTELLARQLSDGLEPFRSENQHHTPPASGRNSHGGAHHTGSRQNSSESVTRKTRFPPEIKLSAGCAVGIT